MATIPLFPLSTVLFPHARMPLQIFERRYLDLVSASLKNDCGFGIVLINQGSEIDDGIPSNAPQFARLGCYARIVDWWSLENNLLGITVEGDKKFRLLSSFQRDDGVYSADVEWLESEAMVSLPEQAEELHGLFQRLIEHPHIARLNINQDVDDASALGCVLAQLLPIDERLKFSMLVEHDPLKRLEQLTVLLDQMIE